MTSLEKLKAANSLRDLAIAIGVKPAALSYTLYKIPDDNKYTSFKIPKKNGGEREIKAPIDRLKAIQKKLAKSLNDCYDEIHRHKNRNKSVSHGFRHDHSIITNAAKHVNKRHVFNVDLKDFFPSIHFGRVQNFFIKDNNFKLNKSVATIIAQISCHEKALPQGSPASPVISNLIGHILDMIMVNLAKKHKCTYSRYADDLTFSTNEPTFPEEIAVNTDGSNNVWVAGKSLAKEIGRARFKINENKTTLQNKTNRQTTTGIVVNKKVNIRKSYFRQVRNMCETLLRTEEFHLGSNFSSNNEKGNINQLEGILSFIHSVKKFDYDKKISMIRAKNFDVKNQIKKVPLPSSTKIYKKFLFYRYFYKNEKPLVICEGKTDIIYLKCALKNIKSDVTKLIDRSEEEAMYLVDFFPMSKNRKSIFRLAEGTSGLGGIIDQYKKFIDDHKKYNVKGLLNPVIILIDNDAGASEIYSRIRNHCNLNKIDNKKDFHYLYENLYVIATPLQPVQKHSTIEDCFDKKTLDKKIKGKKFNKNNDIDPSTDYGKSRFAEKIVKMKQKQICFDGFEPVLNRISLVIDNFKEKTVQNTPTE